MAEQTFAGPAPDGTEAELIAASSVCDKALFVLPPT